MTTTLAMILCMLSTMTLLLAAAPSYALDVIKDKGSDCRPQLACIKWGKVPPGAFAGPCVQWDMIGPTSCQRAGTKHDPTSAKLTPEVEK